MDENTPKRIFVAIKVDQFIKQKVAEIPNTNQKMRQIPLKNLHITLVPPWEENDIEKVKSKLETINFSSFNMRIIKSELGPFKNSPRLAWLLIKKNNNLTMLKNNILKVLNKKRQRKDKFHITYLRFKLKEVDLEKMAQLNKNIYWTMKIKKFSLLESITNKDLLTVKAN